MRKNFNICFGIVDLPVLHTGFISAGWALHVNTAHLCAGLRVGCPKMTMTEVCSLSLVNSFPAWFQARAWWNCSTSRLEGMNNTNIPIHYYCVPGSMPRSLPTLFNFYGRSREMLLSLFPFCRRWSWALERLSQRHIAWGRRRAGFEPRCIWFQCPYLKPLL